MPHRGFFITFEGGDGGGKTTQIQRLSTDLTNAGYLVCVTREPGGTPISEKIRDIFLDPDHARMAPTTELLLVAAARAQHVSEVIRPALESGQVVICARFVDSSIAYQGYRGGLDLNMIRDLNQIATGGLAPDLTFVLDLPAEIGLHRKKGQGAIDRLEREGIASQQRVRDGYLAIANEEPHRVKVIDAQANPDTVYGWIKTEVNQRLQRQALRSS